MKLMTSAIIRKSSFFLLGGMATAAGWGVYTAGNIFDKMKESQMQEGNNPVAISATAPARDGISTLPFTTTSHLRRTANRISAAAPSLAGDNPMSLPTATMNSTSLFAHGGTIAPQETSSRSVTRSSGGSASQIRSTAEDAKRTQPISRGGNMLALSSSTMITTPGAANAAAIATMAVNSASISSGPRKTEDGEYPGGRPDPIPDEEDPTPVGDVAWALMALLAAAYAVFTTRAVRKARQKEK